MVIFRSADGRPGYHQAEGLDEAVQFVERLRNEDSVTDSRIFHMEEVPIEFRTYYKVAVAPTTGMPAEVDTWAPAPPPADAAPVEDGVVSSEESAPLDSVPAPEPTGRFGLFTRS